MSVPTTLWGNLTDVYTAVPGPTASSPGSSDGPVLGNAAQLADGSFVQFLQFYTGTTALNMACKFAGSAATYRVTQTTAANDLVVAVNDLSLTSLTATYCAWGKIRGLCYPLVATTTAANKIVASSATAGTLAAAAAASDLQGNIVNTVLVGGSDALSPCYIQ